MRLEFLSKREYKVFELLMQGLSTKRIAELLFISEGTVTTHKKHIYEKFDVHSIAELMAMYIEELKIRLDVFKDYLEVKQ